MMPWIQVYSNLPEHPKIYRLTEALELEENYEALGIVVALWLWAAKNAPEGDLTAYPRRALKDAVGWNGAPEELARGLLAAGFLEEDPEGGLHIHDWEDHAVMLMELMERSRLKNRERVRRHRRNHAISAAQEAEGTETGQTGELLPQALGSALPDLEWEYVFREFTGLDRWSDRDKEKLRMFYEDMGAARCREAIDLGRQRQRAHWPYIRGILENWHNRTGPIDEDRSEERNRLLAEKAVEELRRKEIHYGLEAGSTEEA